MFSYHLSHPVSVIRFRCRSPDFYKGFRSEPERPPHGMCVAAYYSLYYGAAALSRSGRHTECVWPALRDATSNIFLQKACKLQWFWLIFDVSIVAQKQQKKVPETCKTQYFCDGVILECKWNCGRCCGRWPKLTAEGFYGRWQELSTEGELF